MTAWERAVEAMARAGFAQFNPGASFDDPPPLARKGWKQEMEAPLTAALPHLRRMLAEELRAEANDMATKEWRTGVRYAADHLVRVK